MNDKIEGSEKDINRQILDTIPVGLLIIRKDKTIFSWNKWLAKKTKITREQAVNHTLHDMFPKMNYARFDWALEQVLSYSNPQIMSQALNKYVIPVEMHDTHYKDIEFMQQHVELHPLKMEEETLCLVVIIDVTSKFYEKTDLLNLAKKYSTESIHDALTGIYNRRYLWDWLENAISTARKKHLKIACCLFDIDHFKEINDTYGHKIGDKYILQFVETVNKLVRGSDVFIRYGGDEFVIISLLENTVEDVIELPKRVIKAFFEPKSSTFQYQLSCSCGIAIWTKDENEVDPKTLLQQADQALYKAKEAGRNCSWLYKPKYTK